VPLPPGFQIIFDNINLNKTSNAKTLARNTHHDFVHAYALLDDVNVQELDDSFCQKDVMQVPNSEFILSMKDQVEIKHTLEILVQRSLADHIPFFREKCSLMTTEHIPHKYSDIMAKKSTIVS